MAGGRDSEAEYDMYTTFLLQSHRPQQPCFKQLFSGEKNTLQYARFFFLQLTLLCLLLAYPDNVALTLPNITPYA